MSALAVGVYFCVWHSVRHVARLVVLDPAGAETLAAGKLREVFTRFARDAAPNTLGALTVLVGLSVLVPVGRTPADLLALYLLLLAVVTLPHVVVVTWMDHEEGVWAVN